MKMKYCWRCHNDLVGTEIHLCERCQEMMNPTPPAPDELTIHVKNNGKPKMILIDAEGNVSRLKINGNDETAT